MTQARLHQELIKFAQLEVCRLKILSANYRNIIYCKRRI
ncbi:protein of unknown function [Moritella yayanosii]|uniref:Uncharacterized protein n=1 Tax=Moritella yayanosii TaxID=69539 RepID=A0A330LZM3_9GAMM|nr:protein of unknown function [Moritella yayanosii]